MRFCTGQLRGETDDIGRVHYVCDDCERRAKLEHEAKFGTYLDRLRALRREREARLIEEAESQVERRCEVCDDPLTPPRTRVCEKVSCIRTYKAEYQRRRFGRSSGTPKDPDSTEPEPARPALPPLDLFQDLP